MYGNRKGHRHTHRRGIKHRINRTKGIPKEKIILLGNPNVGKSVIFSLLTGKYVTVSNYPGTTVEVMEGKVSFRNKSIIVDTPGINSLLPQSEDERVTRDIILNEKIQNVVQVADTKNLRRTLNISLQLAEAELPFILVLNMNDEAVSRGIIINREKISEILGVKCISTIATQRKGIKELINNIYLKTYSDINLTYNKIIEDSITKIIPLLPKINISKRFIALMLLSGDESINKYLNNKITQETMFKIERICKETKAKHTKPLSYIISQTRLQKVDIILNKVMKKKEKIKNPLSARIGQIAMHPFWGIPIVIFVMFITYEIVGVLGAGICVDFLETVIFGKLILPFFSHIVGFIPVPLLREFLLGDFGIITMALTYAIAIVLPIVGFFFLIFGFLEDSGYLPRLAIMVNKIFNIIGLNGKAVLPMILGLGCDTMATLTARILPTKKERIIVTLLLALAIPCSAQLGLIFGATSTISGKATLIWAGVILLVIFLVGFLSSKLIRGKTSDFILEIPPIRVPKISNIIIKTLARITWYLKEAVPLFIIGTSILFFLSKTGLITVLEKATSPLVVNLLQLPKEAATAFIMGFLRRDYAVVLLVKSGNLSAIQMLVSIVTITLFVPCIANLFIMIKERGLKTALLITAFIFIFAFLFGALFNQLIRLTGLSL